MIWINWIFHFSFDVWLQEIHKSIGLANFWFALLTRNRDARRVSSGNDPFHIWRWWFMEALPLMIWINWIFHFSFDAWSWEIHKSIDLANLWFAPLTRNRDARGVSSGTNTFYSWYWWFLKALPLIFHCLLCFCPLMSKFRSPNKYMQVEDRRKDQIIVGEDIETWKARHKL
jgi:hypothetical protein